MARRNLVVFLRIYGTVCALAIIAVFMPRQWMAVAHAFIGLGDFPPGPIVEYLARSTSAFYALFGVLMWHMSYAPARYAQLIAAIGWIGVFSAPLMLVMDTRLHMPPRWQLGEGPIVLIISLILLVLLCRYQRSVAQD